MSTFMLLAYDQKLQPQLSAEEAQQVMQKYIDWSVNLRKRVKVLHAAKLTENEGRVLRNQGAEVIITDGPFLETNEVLGGYWMFEAESYEAALEVAADHPHLLYSGTLALREVDPT